jgi:hypothetical protein
VKRPSFTETTSTEQAESERRYRGRRRRRLRPAKLAVVFFATCIFATGGFFLVSYQTRDPGPTGSTITTSTPPTQTEDSTGSTVAPATVTTEKPAGRQIAAIVYLTADGLPSGTFESLLGLHATEVYLYVAYYSDAYYAIPKNPYGLAQPRDTLGTAIEQLHGRGYRVIGVISSALLDWRQAPKAGLDILQSPKTPLFDPVKAGPLLENLTRSLVTYKVDGVYVGEPYWFTPTTNLYKQREFNTLYEQLLAITAAAGIPFHMVMPTYYMYFDNTETASLDPSFAALPFEPIGMDGEDSYYGSDRVANLAYFRRLLDATKAMAGARDMLLELSLHQAFVSTPVPVDFFATELSEAKTSGINTVVIFAAQFWTDLPDKAAYSAALADFVAP